VKIKKKKKKKSRKLILHPVENNWKIRLSLVLALGLIFVLYISKHTVVIFPALEIYKKN